MLRVNVWQNEDFLHSKLLQDPYESLGIKALIVKIDRNLL